MNGEVLLYSGGMDSLCAAWLHEYDTLVRIPSGAAYDAVEGQRCAALAGLHARWREVAEVGGMFNFSRIERPDGIVPNRNAHLVLAASLYGDVIHLAAVDGDRSNDKDVWFAARMVGLLEHMWDTQHWTQKRRFAVELPVKHLCKSELLHAALEADMPHSALYVSYSCYAGRETQCGVCKPCVRKYVAMRAVDVHVPGFLFAKDPRTAAWLPDALLQCATEQGWRCKVEDADFLRVLG